MAEEGRPAIDATLVRRLVTAQFPQWADLPIEPVSGGWDNRTFRIGDELSARLPSRRRYAAAVAREQAWLPRLAPHLPLPIPAPVALGEPGEGYPSPWSVCRWLVGEAAAAARPDDLGRFAEDLADFLLALQRVASPGGPEPGPENFHRGGSLSVYAAQFEEAIAALEGEIDTTLAQRIWSAAMAARFADPPVWIHGDVAPSNLLVGDGRLAAVIDFGQCAVGDPACDLGIAWTLFDPPARTRFRARLAPDAGLWARAKGWTLWKGAIMAAGMAGNLDQVPLWRGALDSLLAEGLG